MIVHAIPQGITTCSDQRSLPPLLRRLRRPAGLLAVTSAVMEFHLVKPVGNGIMVSCGAWHSPVVRTVRVREVSGSNPLAPTGLELL